MRTSRKMSRAKMRPDTAQTTAEVKEMETSDNPDMMRTRVRLCQRSIADRCSADAQLKATEEMICQDPAALARHTHNLGLPSHPSLPLHKQPTTILISLEDEKEKKYLLITQKLHSLHEYLQPSANSICSVTCLQSVVTPTIQFTSSRYHCLDDHISIPKRFDPLKYLFCRKSY